MTSLHRGFAPASHVGTAPLRHNPSLSNEDRPRRPSGLMRKFEIAALRPDLSIDVSQHVAPATPFFESCAAAFARGTLVETVRGPVAIEDLVPGNYIQTALGAEPVTWIGSTTYVPGRSDEESSLTRLVRVTADAMGLGQPPMDLLVGPAARMMVRHPRFGALLSQDSVLAPVADYVDGDRFLEITPAGPVQLYHLMVRRHTTLRIGGLEIETFHPGNTAGEQLGPKTRTLFLSMFPNIADLGDFGETCATRTTRETIENLLSV
jgi:hypothetical protein